MRSAFQKARRTGKAVRAERIEFVHHRRTSRVNIEVRPLVPRGPEKSYLILFEPVPEDPVTPAKPAHVKAAGTQREAREVILLRGELARTREYVQAIIRDQETTNEELKAANEEAVSSMEELQSTNEELETAKEELQSSNEELVTLNEQLQNRNSELSLLSTDLSNVLGGVDVAIVILGPDRHIRRFTPPAEKLLGLISGDVGRPVSKLRLGVHVPDLDDLISEVVRKGRDVVREVQTESGRWYLFRIHPFRTGEDKIEGVLMAFVDIHELKQHEETLQKDRNFISAILDAAKGLLVVVLDREGRIVHFNLACQESTGYSLEEVRGRRVWDFLVVPDEIEAVKATFQGVAAGKSNQRENYWVAKDGRRLLISWSNSVVMSDSAVESVIATGIDVTERQEARRRADQSDETVRALLENAAQAIFACNKDGLIVLANATAEKMFGYSRDVLLKRSLETLIPERFRRRHAMFRAAWSAEPSNRPMGIGLDLAGVRQDGTEFPIEVSLSYIGADPGTLAVAFVSDITERKKNERTLLEYKDQLQNLTGALLSAQETGNREIARELHDVFSQELAAVNMDLSALKESLKNNDGVAGLLSEIGKRIGRLSADLHQTARELHPAILEELGLEPALQQECESFQHHSGIRTEFTAKNVPSVAKDVALCLYRVAQESLRNVRKHSESPRVRMRLEGTVEGILLRIEDEGDGFDLDKALKKGGLGLISMEERMRLVNGKLTIQSKPGAGTIVSALGPAEKPV